MDESAILQLPYLETKKALEFMSHPQNPPADNTRFEGVTDQDPATNYTEHWINSRNV